MANQHEPFSELLSYEEIKEKYDNAIRHYNNLSPHIKNRKTAEMLKQMIDLVEYFLRSTEVRNG